MSNDKFSLKAVFSCVDNISKPLASIQRNVRTLDSAFSDVAQNAANLAGKLMLPLSALAGAGALSLQNSITKFAELGDSIDKAAARVGVGTEALQKLRLAAEFGGSSAEQMDQALAKLAFNMGQAASGANKGLLQTFNDLGISVTDSTGSVRNSAEVMRELAEAIRVNENPTKRLQILTGMFGDDLAKMMIPVLSAGAAGLDEVSEKADRLGIVMSRAEVTGAAQLTDAMTLFHHVIDGVSVSIGAKLSPVLIRIIEQVQDAIAANKDLIATRVNEFVTELSDVIKDIDLGAVINGFFDFIRTVMNVINAIGGFKTIIYAVAAILGANLLVNLIQTTTALFNFGKAMYAVAGPWGLLAAAIVAIVALIVSNWDTITETFDACCDAVSNRVKRLADGIRSIWSGVKSFVSSIIDWISEKLSPITSIASKLIGVGSDATVMSSAPVRTLSAPLNTAQDAMNGVVTVRVEASDGTKAQVENLESTGGTLEAQSVQSYDFAGAF